MEKFTTLRLYSALLLSLFTLLFTPILFNSTQIYGQGTCSCGYSGGYSCNAIGINNCSSGYIPVCEGGLCANGPQCTCESQSSVDCGNETEPCCPGNTCFPPYNCWNPYGVGGRCMRTCSSVNECESGEVCSFGACVPNPYLSPTPPPTPIPTSPLSSPTPPPACISDGQCVGPSELCCSGISFFDTTCYAIETRCGIGNCSCTFSGGLSCDTIVNNNCATNYSPFCQGCSENPNCECELTPLGCGAENEECCPGEECDLFLECISLETGTPSHCLRPCETDEDCNTAAGEICYNGGCTSDPTYGPPPATKVVLNIYCDSNGNPTSTNTGDLYTAIGCIPFTSENAFARFFLTWGIGIAAGLAFILIIVAAFQIITSSGDPKKLQAGKELLTAAIAGLLLLIFSAFILRIVGVQLLGIPGFG